MNEARDEGSSGKYEGMGAGRDKDKKNTTKTKKMDKEDTAGVNKTTGIDNRCEGQVITNKEENPSKNGDQAKNKDTDQVFKDIWIG